jgi:hypothetical protein
MRYLDAMIWPPSMAGHLMEYERTDLWKNAKLELKVLQIEEPIDFAAMQTVELRVRSSLLHDIKAFLIPQRPMAKCCYSG